MYSWQQDYIAALRETDDAKLPYLIYEAIAAIEQRLLSHVKPDSDEDKALRAAQKSIAAQSGKTRPLRTRTGWDNICDTERESLGAPRRVLDRFWPD